MPTTSGDFRGRFATTNWSLIGRLEGPEGASALAALCEQYWFPLYAYVRRRLEAAFGAGARVESGASPDGWRTVLTIPRPAAAT